MTWQPPDFTEINMSAEIGGYQDEFEERSPGEPPSVKPAYTDVRVNED
jgi:hypothetical protein